MKKTKRNILVKLVIIIFAVYAVTTLLSSQVQNNEERIREENLKRQIMEQEQINNALSAAIDSDPDELDMERIAREKLGMVDPGEILFVDISR